MTGNDQIGYPVAAPLGTGLHMVDFERNPADVAVRAAMLPLREQIVTKLDTGQGAVLIVEALDLRVVEQLHIKAHQLIGNRPKGTPACEACHPGQDIVQAAQQRKREPALWAAAIAPAGLPRAPMVKPPSTPGTCTLEQILVDLLPAMGNLCGPRNLSCCVIDHRQPTRFLPAS